MAPHSMCRITSDPIHPLRTTNKRKSKLLWLCTCCEQDFLLYKAGKSIQEEMEAIKSDLSSKLYKLTADLNKFKREQTEPEQMQSNPRQLENSPQRSAAVKESADKLKEMTERNT